jgi:plastocyanin
MRPVLRGIAALSTAIMFAACSGNTPTTGPVGATNPPATTTAAAPCTDSTATTTVEAHVKNNTWSQPVDAKVGDVITWTNDDGVPHRVGLVDGSCKMGANIAGNGGTASLVFSVAGTYPFVCLVHPSMKGTITIS